MNPRRIIHPHALKSTLQPDAFALFCFFLRAIQLGLRGDALAAFRGPAFGETGIQDVSAFAKATEEIHRPRAADGGGGGGHPDAPAATSPPALLLPIEETYPVMDASVAQRLGID